jgi:RNA polymerase sigma factor (sigma-70 family)
LKKQWSPTPRAFHQFLNWLGEGVDSGGEKYLEMRRRLVSYFDRKNCLTPDELTDETLNRVARRLDEESAIEDATPAQYCYIVARFVFLEYQRRAEHTQVSFDEVSAAGPEALHLATPSEPDRAIETRGNLLHCLEECLRKLPPDNQELIVEYYRHEKRAKIERRRELAARLGLSLNAVAIRACRIRDKLEACVRTCSASAEVFSGSGLIKEG